MTVSRQQIMSLIKEVAEDKSLCFLYDNDEDWKSFILPLIRFEEERGGACLYIYDRKRADYFEKSDFGEAIQSVPFPSGRMVFELIEERCLEAKRLGFPIKRVLVEYNWSHLVKLRLETIIEYEKRFNRLIETEGINVVGQFSLQDGPGSSLLKSVIGFYEKIVYRVSLYRNKSFTPHFNQGDIEQTLNEMLVKKSTQQELEERNRMLKKLIDQYPKSIVSVINRELIVKYSGGQEYRRMGLKPEDFIGRPYEDIFGGNSSLIRKKLRTAFKCKENSFELNIDSQLYLFRTVYLDMPGGKIENILIVSENITESYRINEALKQKSSELAERVKELNCLYSISRLLDAPEGTLDDILQVTVDVIPPAWKYPSLSVARLVIYGKEYRSEDYKEPLSSQRSNIYIHGNSAGYLEVGYTEEQDELDEGPFLHEERLLVEAITERIGSVIERKEMDRELQNNRKYLSDILEFLPVGITITDLDGNILQLNQKFERLFGYTPVDIQTMNAWNRLAFPEKGYRTRMEEIQKSCLDRLMGGAEEVSCGEVKITCRDGKIRYAEVAEKRTHGRNLFVYFDVTERREAELALERAKELAEEASISKSNFLASISHELRTPLNSILGFSDLLISRRDRIEQELLYEYLGYIYDSGCHLLDMVNEILDLAKIESGKMALLCKTFDCGELLDQIPALVKSQVEKKGILLKYSRQFGLGWLNGDRVKLKQIIYNLLSNAIKFTESGKAVGVESTVENDSLIVEVWDEGVGIAEKDYKRIFEPFEQLDNGKGEERGTGLGLAITKKLVELHGGTITLTSRVGEGSRFTVTLPGHIAREEYDIEYVTGESKEKVVSKPLESKKVLVVDDSLVNRVLMEEMLSGESYEVLFAEDGDEAIELALKNRFSLILMDIQMPRVDGVTAMKKIRQEQQEYLPILALTAFAMKGDRDRLLLEGFDDYLSKPVNEQLLKEKINSYLKDQS